MVALWEALIFTNVGERWALLTFEAGVPDKRRVVWPWQGCSLFLDTSTSWGEYLSLSCWMLHYVHQLVPLTFVCGLVLGRCFLICSFQVWWLKIVCIIFNPAKWTSWPLVLFLAPSVFQTQGITTTNALTLQLVFPQRARRDGWCPRTEIRMEQTSVQLTEREKPFLSIEEHDYT